MDNSKYDLTPEEAAAVLAEARHKKAAKIKEAEYWAEVRKEPEYPKYTATELMTTIEAYFLSKGWLMDQFNRPIIENLCKYFTKDASGPLNLKKGILLRGGVGCGKTSIMRLFQYNQSNSFNIVSCRDVAYKFANEGHGAISQYNSLWFSSNLKLTFGQKEVGTCFDDLGTEEEKKNFGNQVNVMSDIILNRYDKLEIMQAKTHLTSNLSIAEIEQFYGTRVKSRLVEMFNDVVFENNSPDRRR